ncbi:amino acid ABC transporter permease [Leucobacter japonicus]|uniref:amino acid ABC transporter permease n=1 Tax=Leucobacter japonicus TaxID=1461259 RepID=UPI0006A7C5F3|nr:amino acid ABC transporter permease [Leucobacter japonicus]
MSDISTWLSWLPEMLGGLWISLQVAVVSLLIGLPLGALLGLLSTTGLVALRFAAIALIEIGRGIPALIFLYFIYYGLPDVGITLSSMVSAFLALSVTAAAYSSELFRAGIQAVPQGEIEAAQALGLSRRHTVFDVVLPQAIKISLPSLIGLSTQIFQATALAYSIALPELLSRAYAIGARTFEFMPALIMTGLLYLVITLPLSTLVQRMSRPKGSARPVRESQPSVPAPL